MRPRMAATAAGLGLALTLSTAGPVAALGTLDQEQALHPDFASGYNNYWAVTQTFTAGLTGQLDTVSMYGEAMHPAMGTIPPGDISVSIVTTTAGLPPDIPFSGPAVLAQEAVQIPLGFEWYDIAFTTPPSVSAGTVYAIVLRAASGSDLTWAGVCGSDPYAGGEARIWDTYHPELGWRTLPDASGGTASVCYIDYAFRTYVTVEAASSEASPPPTGTSGSPSSGSSPLPALLFASMAAAAAFVAIRRIEPIGR